MYIYIYIYTYVFQYFLWLCLFLLYSFVVHWKRVELPDSSLTEAWHEPPIFCGFFRNEYRKFLLKILQNHTGCRISGIARSMCQIAGRWYVMFAIAWCRSLLGLDCKDGIKRTWDCWDSADGRLIPGLMDGCGASQCPSFLRSFFEGADSTVAVILIEQIFDSSEQRNPGHPGLFIPGPGPRYQKDGLHYHEEPNCTTFNKWVTLVMKKWPIGLAGTFHPPGRGLSLQNEWRPWAIEMGGKCEDIAKWCKMMRILWNWRSTFSDKPIPSILALLYLSSLPLLPSCSFSCSSPASSTSSS